MSDDPTRGLPPDEASLAELIELCVPLIDEVIAETRELYDAYDHNIDGIDPNGVPQENGEPSDFLSFFQTEGVGFAFKKKRGMLADQMGVGKTPQAVALHYEIENRTGKPCRTLVICPNSVKEYWAQCIHAWSLKHRVGKVVFLERYERAALEDAEDADWVIVNYDLLAVHPHTERTHAGVTTRKRVYRWLLRQRFRLVVLDEVQNAKNEDRPLSQNVVEIARKAEYLLLLSGTPIPNWLRDIFVIMTLLEPDIFPDVKTVRGVYYNDPRIIRAFLKRRRLKRSLAEVVKLPPRTVERIWLDLPEAQEAIYNAVRENYALSGGVKLLRLKQALLDPRLVPTELLPSGFRDGGHAEPVKYLALDRIVDQAMQTGEKVVIFSPLARELVIERLAERYRHHGVIIQDGTVKESARREMRRRFRRDPSIRVCLATDVVGEGVDLTPASVVVFLDLPYAPGEYDQMVARVHRRGQTKPVRIYELLVRGTVDEGTVQFLETKREAIRFIETGFQLTAAQLEVMRKQPYELHAHRQHMWTGQEYINWYAARMAGIGYEKNHRALERNNAEIARHYADCYVQEWERTVSANGAEVCRRIVLGFESVTKLPEKVDLGGAFGVLSHVLGERTIVTEINPHHFETVFYREHIAPLGNELVIAPYHHLPKEWTKRFDLVVNALGLHQCSRDERRHAIREAWRVLRPGGYFLVTLPLGTIGEYGPTLVGAVRDGGWKIVTELTGVVESVEPAGLGFRIFVLVAQKGSRVRVIPPAAVSLDCDDFVIRGERRRRLSSQARAGRATAFAIEGGESLEARLARYLKRIRP